LRPLSYPDSHVILICFAIDKRESRDNVARKWFYELQQYCPTVPRLLVGCKSDLRVELAPSLLTTEEEGQDMAQRIGAVSYVECSAKTRHHINEVFAQAARVSLTYQRPKKRSKSTVSRNRKCTIQ
jgi:GTPase SAR1 family protein